jgi:hypothetical protein
MKIPKGIPSLRVQFQNTTTTIHEFLAFPSSMEVGERGGKQNTTTTIHESLAFPSSMEVRDRGGKQNTNDDNT